MGAFSLLLTLWLEAGFRGGLGTTGWFLWGLQEAIPPLLHLHWQSHCPKLAGEGDYLKKIKKKNFFSHHMVCGVLVSLPRIKHVPPALKLQSLSHWTARQVPRVGGLFALF